MRSKGALDRQRVAKTVIAAARVHAQEVGEQLRNQFATVTQDGESLPDFTLLQVQLARFLEMRLDALMAAEDRHRLELADDHDIRLRRDEESAAVQQQLVALREAVSAIYGSERVPQVLGLDGCTAQSPFGLLAQAQRVLGRLREPVTVEPVSRLLPADQLDLSGAAERLQEHADALDRTLKEVERETCEAEQTRNRRDEAMEALDLAIRGVGHTVKSFFSLAGLGRHADKLRLTVPARRAVSRRGKEC